MTVLLNQSLHTSEPLSGGPSSNLLLVGFNLIPDKSLPTGVTIGEIEPDDHLNI